MTYDLDLSKADGLFKERFPETNVEGEIAEKILSKSLDGLSLDEHEKLILEVLGIVSLPVEDPAFIEAKLIEMDIEILNLENKEAYELAKQQNNQYVTNRRFRIMFLRSQCYDAKAAANLMVNHFERKRVLFGDGEILSREVRQADLTPEDRNALELGLVQILPTRDVSGRTVVFMSATRKGAPEGLYDKEKFRANWYLFMAALQDEETQKKGFINLSMNFSGKRVSVGQLQSIMELSSGIPLRYSGGHFCYNDPALRPYAAGVCLHINNHRFRSHCGKKDEIFFSLQTYGLFTQDIPLSEDGQCDTTAHLGYLNALKSKEEFFLKDEKGLTEEVGDLSKPVVIPHRFDVLFGKCTQARDHTGTLRALHLVEMHYDAYEALGKYQKTEMAERIIDMIHESGGRFLRQEESGLWIPVEHEVARKKIAHWFRHARRKRNKTAKIDPDDGSSSSPPQVERISTASKRVHPTDTSSDNSEKQQEESGEVSDFCQSQVKKPATEVSQVVVWEV